MDLQKKINEAIILARSGSPIQAIHNLQKIEKKFSRNPQLLNNIANLAFVIGNLQITRKYLEKSLEIHFDLGVINNLVNLYQQTQDWNTLIKCYERYKKYNLTVDIKIRVAMAYRDINETEKSLELYQSMIEKQKTNIDLYISYGYTLNKLKKYKEAVEVYKLAIKCDENNFRTLYNLGVAYANLNDYENSIKYLTMAALIDSSNFNLWITLSAQQNKFRKYSDAMLSLSKCKQIDPKNILIDFQMAAIKMQRGEIDIAEKILKEIIQRDSSHIEANYHLGLVYLMKKRFKEAVRYYRYRLRRENYMGLFDDFHLPDLKKQDNILIGWEQGIGDQLLFIRLLGSFSKMYPNITYITTDKLYKLLSYNFPHIKFIKDSEFLKHHIKNFDIKLNIGSILHYIKNINNALNDSKFLDVPSEHKNKDSDKGLYKIGISWLSKNENIGKEKSINLADLEPILKKSKCKFINLQYGDIKNDIDLIKSKIGVDIYFDPNLDYYNDMLELSQKILECDLVITISNVTAHLAGSLGVKTCLIIPKSFGRLWYWHDDQETSLWYPNVKFYHQMKDQKWDDVILKIKNDLVDF